MSKLLTGYARRCITPKESVPLGGYGNSSARMSQNVLSDLYATCVAFTDAEDSTILLFHLDLISVDAEVFDPIRQTIADKLGISVDRVMASATHTHSAPEMLNTAEPTLMRYRDYLAQQVVDCAMAAMADRKPSTISIAGNKTKDLSFVRHYVLEDGSYMGVNLNLFAKSPIAFHSSEPDPFMRLVKFTREGGSDILLANWQCHPHRTGFGKFDISADIIGVMRDELEAALGCDFIYFNGGNGNINPKSFDPKDKLYEDFRDQGKALADCALAVKDEFVPVESGRVQVITKVMREPFRRPDPAMREVCYDVAAFWKKNNNHLESAAYAESKGLHSQYHAMNYIDKEKMVAAGVTHLDIPIAAFSIGDVSFIAAPYEMFDTNGKYVRDFSPFKATIVASNANAQFDYIPSAYGFLNDCYESDCTHVTAGAGERLAQQYVKMLEKLYETK